MCQLVQVLQDRHQGGAPGGPLKEEGPSGGPLKNEGPSGGPLEEESPSGGPLNEEGPRKGPQQTPEQRSERMQQEHQQRLRLGALRALEEIEKGGGLDCFVAAVSPYKARRPQGDTHSSASEVFAQLLHNALLIAFKFLKPGMGPSRHLRPVCLYESPLSLLVSPYISSCLLMSPRLSLHHLMSPLMLPALETQLEWLRSILCSY